MTNSSYSNSVEIVKAYFRALENHDEAAGRASFADDVTETVPLNASGNPEPQALFKGKEEVLGYFRMVITNFKQTRLADPVFTVNSDDTTVFCEAKGDLVSAKDSTPYKNIYVFRFDLKDGRISRIAEYANPVTYAKMMGLPIG